MKLIALLLIISACNTGKTVNSQSDTALPADIPRDTIRTVLNGSFKIELGTTMGTGFSWSLKDSMYKSFLVLDSTKVLNDVEGKDNAPDTQQFFFTGIKKGETKLHFIRKRSWENDPPDKQRIFNIFVE
jgi:predicted secreted protein